MVWSSQCRESETVANTSTFIGGGRRKYYREERYFLLKIHKYFCILWSSISEGERPLASLVSAIEVKDDGIIHGSVH